MLLTFFVLLFSQFSWSIPELNYASEFNARVIPFYNKSPSRYLKNSQGIKLHFKSFRRSDSRKTIVCLPGRTDAVARNAETLYDLYQKGFSVYMMDEQGQGQSGRMLADASKGHVRKFQDYVNDLDLFLKRVVSRESQNQELFFLGHSMGAAIGTLYDHQHPGVFSKLALAAPMFEIRTGGEFRYNITFKFVRFAVNHGLGNNYFPGSGPFNLKHYKFSDNIYTHSLARFNNSIEIFNGLRPSL